MFASLSSTSLFGLKDKLLVWECRSYEHVGVDLQEWALSARLPSISILSDARTASHRGKHEAQMALESPFYPTARL